MILLGEIVYFKIFVAVENVMLYNAFTCLISLTQFVKIKNKIN